ncbi:hypothetical protein BS47DRAFT_1371371 [Hydnum rufescens UP504]|uniref:Sec24-like protein n=1 Tax=Hydnum rufescens UP504 TaxID=1448309 RepID=A0A9P6B4I5_9AGAM|nr:hypothetical protein BS47DRAFT_1371371 [Hydnum rufescens UP504]
MSRSNTTLLRPIPQPPHSAGRRFGGLRASIPADQVPSPVASALADQRIWSSEPFLTCDTERAVPLAGSDYNAVDQGNSSPRFLRPCTYAIPNSHDLATSCEVPLSLVLQPFAQQRAEEYPVPVVDFGAPGPPRCGDCRAYVNPWCIWIMNGQRWICNICRKENPVAADYYSPLDPSGKRSDLPNKPELKHGTVDFVVPMEYWAQPAPPRLLPLYSDDSQLDSPSESNSLRPPQPMSTLFMIDVSQPATSSGLVAFLCNSIREILYGSDAGNPFENRLVGFMTFDSTLHFYNISSDLVQPGMLIVSDIDEVFSPFRQGLFVDPQASRALIERLLDIISQQFVDRPNTACALSPALRGALAAMLRLSEKVTTGGQVMLFQSSLPNFGSGALSTRNEVSLYGTDKEKTLFQPQEASWQDLAQECAEAGVGVHMFLFPTQYIDVTSIGIVASLTGGDIFYHPRFVPERDSKVLRSELHRVALRETGYDVSIRARISNGLRVLSYEGNFLEQATGDIKMGNLDADKALSVTFGHERTLDIHKDIYVQCAILYTSTLGERRVRTVNLALGFVSRMHSENLNNLKQTLTERCAALLLAYRRQCAASTAPTQLILPESFKLLPIYALSFLKSKSIKGGSIGSDIRNYDAHRIKWMGATSLLSYLYPRLIAIHDLDEHVGIPDLNSSWIPLPTPMRPSYLYMEAHGAYLIDNGELTVLWIGAATSPQILHDLFGVDNLDEIPRNASLMEPRSLLATQVQNIIHALESRRGGRTVPFLIARQNMDAAEIEFSNMLVEDQNNDAMSHTDCA